MAAAGQRKSGLCRPPMVLAPFRRRGYACGMSTMFSQPHSADQIIDAAMARALHADACRDHAIVAWVVLWDSRPIRNGMPLGWLRVALHPLLTCCWQIPRPA